MDLNKDVEVQYGLIGDAKLTLAALRAGDGSDYKPLGRRRAPRRAGAHRRACASPGSPSGQAGCEATTPRSIPTG